MTPTVNPERLTKFDRTQDELFRFLFFSVAVAGKTAKQVALKVNSLFSGVENADLYLSVLFDAGTLLGALERERMGKYNTLMGFYRDWCQAGLNLDTCSVDDLEKLHGVGPKTARMFLLHSRPNQRFAVLDTHVLKILRERYPSRAATIPKSTPSGRKYSEIEQLWFVYIHHVETHMEFGRTRVLCSKGSIPLKVDANGKLDIAAFDLDLWRLYSGNEDDYA